MFKPSTKLALLAVTGLLCGKLSAQTWDPAMKPGTPVRTSPPVGLGIGSSASYNQTDFNNLSNSDYQKLGWQYDLFLMNIPLAWNITKGKPDVVVAIGNDVFVYPTTLASPFLADPEHPDVVWRKQGQTTGNFWWLNQDFYDFGEDLATYGTGGQNMPTAILGGNGHGFSVLSLAVAQENGTGMAGVAPQSSAVAINIGNEANQLDLDNDASAEQKVPDVLTLSSLLYDDSFKTDVQNGIVLVGGVGNHMDIPGHGAKSVHVKSADNPCQDITTDYWGMIGPRANPPANIVWEDLNTKVIAVGNVSNGSITRNSGCGIYMDGQGTFFDDMMNYSPGREKFPAPSQSQKAARRAQAFMDLVVPKNEIIGLIEFDPTTSSYITDPDKRYHHGDAGTSQAVGQVGGVVALMRSASKYLSLSGVPSNKADIHRRAYDILTFTARKVEDRARAPFIKEYDEWVDENDNGLVDEGEMQKVQRVLPESSCWSASSQYFPPDANNELTYPLDILDADELKDLQFEYVIQEHDNLKRTWAQRMGFGMVDAYRAVAHSIPVKANYKYQQNTTLSGGHLNAGRYFVHFGSKVNEKFDLAYGEDRNGNGQNDIELNVLQWGGADMPNEDHNNQGVTRIEGISQTITITVPQNYVAAIDGIVKTPNNSTARSIVTSAASGSTNDHGLILASGMLDGVNLKGRVKVGDLLVNPNSNNASGITVQNHGATNDPASRVGSEIFGVVTLKKNATLVVDNNATLTLQPGAVVDMQGTQDITVKSGGTLIMEYPSTITGKETNRLVVESGGTVIIRTKPSAEKIWKTELLTRVEIRDGAQLIAEEGAFYKLKTIDVKTGGVWDCKKGSHTVLVSGGNMLGKWYVQGEAGKEAMVTGDIDFCGNVTGKALITAIGVINVTSQYDISKKKLSFNRAIFDNVRINARNMNVDPIEHCQFRSNRDVFGKREMLRLVYTGSASVSGMFPSVENVTVQHCTFLDRKGDMEIEDNDQWRGNDKYHVTGLAVRGMKNVTVEHSAFNSLMHSINSYRCSRVLVSKNTFDFANAAVHDDASAVTFCDNICKKTEFTNGYNFSRASVTVDNTYTNIRSSVVATSTGQQFIRSNVVTDFREGVTSHNSPLVMKPYTPLDVDCPWGSGIPVYTNGYNDFVSNVENHIPSEYLQWNPAHTARLGAQQIDIAFEPFSMIEVARGLNKFSLYSGNHLVNRNLPVNNVNVSYNEWLHPAGHQVRYDNTTVSISGSVLDDEETLTQKQCGVMTGCQPDGTPIFCAGDLYPNDGAWTEKPGNDPYLNDAYSHARTRMMDYAVDPLCRRIKAHDAIQAAVLGTSMELKLRTLATDYAILAGDPSAPVVLKTTALMLKGEAHERLNEPDSAVMAYSVITTVYPTSADSMSAAWRIHNINAEQSDSTYGLTYDASMSAWRERVLDDMRRRSVYTTTGPHKYGADEQQAIAGMPVETRLEQNMPNPFGEETQIGYSLAQSAHVRLMVSDVTGRTISVLVDRAQEAGSYTVPVSAAGLTTGVYWYHLEVNGAIISRQMTVIR